MRSIYEKNICSHSHEIEVDCTCASEHAIKRAAVFDKMGGLLLSKDS